VPFNPFKRKPRPAPVPDQAVPYARDLPGRPVPFDGIPEIKEDRQAGFSHTTPLITNIFGISGSNISRNEVSE